MHYEKDLYNSQVSAGRHIKSALSRHALGRIVLNSNAIRRLNVGVSELSIDEVYRVFECSARGLQWTPHCGPHFPQVL